MSVSIATQVPVKVATVWRDEVEVEAARYVPMAKLVLSCFFFFVSGATRRWVAAGERLTDDRPSPISSLTPGHVKSRGYFALLTQQQFPQLLQAGREPATEALGHRRGGRELGTCLLEVGMNDCGVCGGDGRGDRTTSRVPVVTWHPVAMMVSSATHRPLNQPIVNSLNNNNNYNNDSGFRAVGRQGPRAGGALV